MPSVVTKADLVIAAARAGNMSKLAAGEAVNAVFDAIVHSVAKGNRVTVVGFGTFLPRKRKARAGRNPTNGKEIKICPTTTTTYTTGTTTPGATVLCKVKSHTTKGKGNVKVNDHIKCTDKPVGNDKLGIKIKSGVNQKVM